MFAFPILSENNPSPVDAISAIDICNLNSNSRVLSQD